MLKNYFIIGIRNLLKQKGYSIIKIAGLSFGLASAMIIYLYVQEDLSFDRFHKNYKQIVRVLTIDSAEGVSSKIVGVTPPALGPAAESEIPEIQKSTRLVGSGRLDLTYEDRVLRCNAAFFSESSFFDVFDFKILEGRKEGILDKPNSIVITESLSKRLFGDESPIGKTIKQDQNTSLFISGLIQDPPKNSHIQFDLLRSLTPGNDQDGLKQFLGSWQGISTFTYFLIDGAVKPADLNTKLKAISKKNNAYDFFTPIVQPLSEVHLLSKDILFESNANKSDILNVYVLSTIALLILVLAIVNFINLVTAKSAQRAKEVGLRKVIGAVRQQLIGQHLTESIVITLLSAVFAVALVITIIPTLNTIYQRFAIPALLLQGNSIISIIGVILLVGILAGLYPAVVLSSFKPAAVLKGDFKSSAGGIKLRKALVVVQFTISIALMAGTAIVYQQMNFIYSADLGYDRNQVVTLNLNQNVAAKATTLRDELLRNPSIQSIGTASSQMGQQLGRTQIFPEGFSNETNIITSVMAVDDQFISTMGMHIIDGRNFSLDYDDSLSMIINEEMARLLKWKEPIGKKISQQTGATPKDLTAYTIVGVVKDFHFATIRHKLEPMFMLYSKNNPSMAVKVKSSDMEASLQFMETTWKKINPGTAFEYNFLDEQFANLYRNEQAFASMFSHFTALAIIIAILGLFALSAFTVEQRKKEIGIRKVLGASSSAILYKLSSEFIQLILVSFVAASGLAYFAMKKWLQDFQYSITITPTTFILVGGFALAIALLTISFQALRAAWRNPVDSLRNE